MKLEVGKKYLTRGGNIVTIIKYDSDYEHCGVKYPYRGCNDHTYKEDGSFITLYDDVSNHDIIEEIE